MADIDTAKVIVGYRDHLFLNSLRHKTLDFAQGIAEPSEQDFDQLRRNLDRRKKFSSLLSSKYVHIVCPEKQSVYRDLFPIQQKFTLGDWYKEKGLEYLYPTHELSDTDYATYKKTDTHWSIKGKIIIALLIAENIGRSPSEVEAIKISLNGSISTSKNEVAGDLGSKLVPPRLEPDESFQQSWGLRVYSNEMTFGTDGLWRLVSSSAKTARGRVVIFGDSYLLQALPMLSAVFSEILFCRTRYMHPEMVFRSRCDYIITANAERYLSKIESDVCCNQFMMFPYINEREQSISKLSAAKISAFLRGDRI